MPTVNLPTRDEAQGYLNRLREWRGDRCNEECSHSVANNLAEHCLEARASGDLMTRSEFVDSADTHQLKVIVARRMYASGLASLNASKRRFVNNAIDDLLAALREETA